MRSAGTLYEIQNGSLEITETAYRRWYEALVGNMTPEEAVDYLEKHGVYNSFILDSLEPRRAIDYLYKVRARQKTREAYARNVLARDPGNPDAQMVMLSAEPDNAIAAAGYHNIVAMDPENQKALNELGYRLHYDNPAEAIHYLKKANSLDATIGFFSLGLAYERLGDFKTAWLYYSKQQTIENGSRVEVHKRAIEKGEPIYSPISLTSFSTPESNTIPLDIGIAPHKPTFAPIVEENLWLPELPPKEHTSENQTTDKENRKVARAAAARAEFQRQQKEFQRQQTAALQEFEEFLKWTESLMKAGDSIDPNDFLAMEFAAYLSGKETKFSPDRIVRAYEMIERYGPEEGLQKLKEKDSELAEQMERLIEERRPPRRTNPHNRK